MTSPMRAALAGLLLVTAACGDVKTNHLADATGSGSGIDGSPGFGDEAPRPVTVHVLDPSTSGADAVGVPVVFIDSASTQTVSTDGSGDATALVLAGASVTSVAAVANGFQLQTITGVQPGDQLTIGQTIADTTLASMTITVPNAGTHLEAYGPCGPSETVAVSPSTGSTVLTIPLEQSCIKTPATIQVAELDANFNTIGILVAPGISVVPGSTNVPVTGAYNPPISLNATFANVSELTSLEFERLAPDGNGFFGADDVEAPVVTAAALGPQLSGTVVADTIATAAVGRSEVRELVPGTATTYAFDGSVRLMPFLSRPTFTLATGVISTPITTTGTSGDAPDLFRVAASYVRTDGATGDQTTFTWTVYAGAVGDITLPTIPLAVADVMPQTTDSVRQLAAESMEIDTVTGYDEARLNPLAAAAQLDVAGGSPAKLIRFSLAQNLR